MKNRLLKSVLVPFAAVVVTLGAGAAQAAPLFAVDVGTDDLVQIESSTGAVSVVGALGFNAVDIDLTRTADGRLWGLNSVLGQRVDLHEIDPATGAVLSSVQVSLGGAGIGSAEGLAHSGNQLHLGFSPAGNANANTFGDLAASGAISNTVTPGLDIDGLGAGAGAVPFYAIDRASPTGTFIYEIYPAVPGNTQIAAFPAASVIVNDLVRDGTEIVMIDNGAALLHSFDLSSPTVLNTVNLSRSGVYLGLANASALVNVIPEPGILTLFGVGLVSIGIARRRKTV